MQAIFSTLVLVLSPAGAIQNPAPAGQVAQVQTPQERLDSIIKRTDEALVAYNAELGRLVEAVGGDHSKIEKWPNPPFPPFLKEAMTTAEEYRDTPDELPFLIWTIEKGGMPLGRFGDQAVKRIEAAHLRSAELGTLAPLLPAIVRSMDEESGLGLAAQLEKLSTVPTVRVYAASIRLATPLAEAALDSKEFLLAKEELNDLIGKTDGEAQKYLKKSLGGQVKARERFAVGKRAPNIKGFDLDGVPFRLSDYDGKIVLLDFWGDW